AAMRFRMSGEICCDVLLVEDDRVCPAMVLNVSTGGVGLLINEYIEPGTSLIIQLTSAARNMSWSKQAIVRHAGDGAAGAFRVGCEFVKHLTCGDLGALLD